MKIGIFNLHTCGIPIKEKGKEQPPVLLFLSGFPDNANIWDDVSSHFHSDYHVVKMAYPCMDTMDQPLPKDQYWGYSLYTVRDNLLQVVQYYRDQLNCQDIALVAHDWGAAAAILYAQAYPTTLTKLVYLDIAPLGLLELGVKDFITFASYQGFLALMFFWSRIFPFCLDVWFPKVMCMYPWDSPYLSPVERTIFGDLSRITPDQCYPYFQMVIILLRSGFNLNLFQDPGGVEKVLFVYGKRKHMSFHGPSIIQYLDKTPGCRHVGYEGVSHWIQTEAPERLAKELKGFLNES